jgi:hypothetical protein
VAMDSYSTASMYKNARHDSFHRELAEVLSRRHAKPAAGVTSGAGETDEEPPFNWMRRGLARVRRS